MANLKRVGVDMENAIFNGLKAVFTNLQCLRCVKHIGDKDKIKLDKLLTTPKKQLLNLKLLRIFMAKTMDQFMS